MAKSVAWSQSNNRAYFPVTEDKTEDRKTHKHAATQGGCSEDLAKGGNSEFGDVHGQRFFIQLLKLHLYLQLSMSLCPNTIEPLKMEVLCLKWL